MPRFEAMPRSCKHHKQSDVNCAYCRLVGDLQRFKFQAIRISPEELLLSKIFGGGRFIPKKKIKPKKKKRA